MSVAAPATKSPTLAAGAVLGERFEVGTVIGEGAMGCVYRAKDRTTGAAVAVKVLHKNLVQSREYLSRFKREANAASRFRHDAAVRVLATGETEDRLPYIAMDLADGKSLREIMNTESPIAPGRAANIVAQLLRGLGAAHRAGIAHRDMKPDNVRVVVDADGIERPKILDFGVAKFIAGDGGEMTGGLKTKTGIVLGTPKYMAPEQIRGEAIDGRADVYSVGAMFYEMLTGKPPFEAEDVFGFVAMHLKEKVVPISERFPDADIPEGLDEAVLEMLAKDPKDRPSDATELAERVAKFAVEDPRAAQKGRELKRGMAAVAVGGLLGVAGGFLLAGPRAGQTVSLAPSVAAASIGLALGAALAAKLYPRPSVYGFGKRLAVVTAGVVVFALVAVAVTVTSLPFLHAVFVAFAFALVALLSYAGYLLVWNSRAVWLRPVVAGLAATAVSVVLLPALVAPEEHVPYFVGSLATSRAEVARLEGDARTQSALAAASIALTFGLASVLLPRPRAARK